MSKPSLLNDVIGPRTLVASALIVTDVAIITSAPESARPARAYDEHMIRHLHRQQFVPGEPARIWEFFSNPRNLDLLTPPDLRFRIVGEITPKMYPGQLIEYRIGILPGIWTRWLTEITHLREDESFVDEQRLGPYRLWHHEHHFAATPDGRGVQMTDRITYDPGWGPIGAWVDALWIKHQLAAVFDFRARKAAELFPHRG